MKNIIKKTIEEVVENLFEADESEETLLAADGIVDTDCVLSIQEGNMKLQWPLFSLPAAYTCPFATRCKNFPAKWDPEMANEKGGQGAFRRFKSTGKTISKTKKTDILCYAARAQAQYPAANMNAFRNLDLLNRASKDKGIEGMVALILRTIDYYETEKDFNFDIFRVHEAGDFFSSDYMRAWFEVARKRPKTLFYAYTTSLPFWVANEAVRPNNFKMIASMDNENQETIESYSLRYSRVVSSEAEAEELRLPVDVDDQLAWDTDINFALMIHGPQHKGSEMAKALKANKEAGVYDKMKEKKEKHQLYKDMRRGVLQQKMNAPVYKQGEFDFPAEDVNESYYGPQLQEEEAEEFDWVGDIVNDATSILASLQIGQRFLIKDEEDWPAKAPHNQFTQCTAEIVDYGYYEKDLLKRVYIFKYLGKYQGYTRNQTGERVAERIISGKMVPIKKLQESEDDLDWAINLTNPADYLKKGQKFVIKNPIDGSSKPMYLEITKIEDLDRVTGLPRTDGNSTYWVSANNSELYKRKQFPFFTKYNTTSPFTAYRIVELVNEGYWEPLPAEPKKGFLRRLRENEEFGSEDILLQGHKDYPGKVFVHRNLHKPPYWTIKARRGEEAGIVIGYDKEIHLQNVTFVVGEKSRQRVLASGQKNVHAGVVGDIIEDGSMETTGWIPVTYNPYKNRTFVRVDTGEPVFKAKEAILKNEKEVYIKI